MPPSNEQDDWLRRVLGVSVVDGAAGAGRADVTALSARAGRLAGAARPAAPPRQQATLRLLSSMAAQPAPDDPAQVPDHVAAFLPAFLVAVEAERPAASQALEAGAPVPGPDQMLGIADLFAAVQQSLIAWEATLDQAEGAERLVDTLEEQEEDRDQAEYATTLTRYNTRRQDGIAAEARATRLMTELQARFNGMSAAQQAATLQENRDA